MNTRILRCVAALSLAVVAAAAWGDEKEAVSDPARTTVVCKKEQVMGTRIPQRVCRTKAQIERDRQNAKESVDLIQQDGNMQKTKG